MALVGASTRFLGAVIVALGGAVMASAHHAAAQPAGFPNLDNFTPVPLDDYLAPLAHGAVVVNFSAPNNLVCDFYGGQTFPFSKEVDQDPTTASSASRRPQGLTGGGGPLTEGQS